MEVSYYGSVVDKITGHEIQKSENWKGEFFVEIWRE